MSNFNHDLLEINDLYKSFQDGSSIIKVLDGVSLSLKKGEILALVGPSACGKSTLLNIIAGLLREDKGDLERLDRSRLAYIFQEPRLLPWMSLEDNISFVQKNFMTREEALPIRNSLLADVDLLDFKDLYPGQLSGGMKQRLEFVRALSIKPDLLLMDEAFKSLDLALKFQLRNLLLKEFAKHKFGILLVTHDPEEAVLLADKIIILNQRPSRVSRVFNIDIKREERLLKDPQIYNLLQDIIEEIISD
ncbi:ABC transporter ATP-binding protein [Natronospora cellulosivora (SeqCode)]